MWRGEVIKEEGAGDKMTAMNSLPNFKNATIDQRKITDYALNPDHPIGGHKARKIKAALGFDLSNAAEFSAQILKQLPTGAVIAGKLDKHGQRYTVDVELTGPTGKSIVRTAWIIEKEGLPPRLVTVYVGD
jgi:hypothetical protein